MSDGRERLMMHQGEMAQDAGSALAARAAASTNGTAAAYDEAVKKIATLTAERDDARGMVALLKDTVRGQARLLSTLQ